MIHTSCEKTYDVDITYKQAVLKGRRLVTLMEADNMIAGRLHNPTRSTASSHITSIDDALTSGYNLMKRTSHNELLEPYEDILRAMGSTITIQQLNQDCGGHNCDLLWVHSFDSEQNDQLCPSTGAKWNNIVNEKAGLLIALDNIGPAHKVAAELAKMRVRPTEIPLLPKLQKWSDAAYLQWQSCTPSTQLRYVLRANIHNADTIAVMSRILGVPANNATVMADGGMSWLTRPHWPGLSFGTEQEEAQALLGTPNGCGVGWLLAQRKTELGHKVIDKVTIFFSELDHEDGDIELQPNLMFHIRDSSAHEQ